MDAGNHSGNVSGRTSPQQDARGQGRDHDALSVARVEPLTSAWSVPAPVPLRHALRERQAALSYSAAPLVGPASRRASFVAASQTEPRLNLGRAFAREAWPEPHPDLFLDDFKGPGRDAARIRVEPITNPVYVERLVQLAGIDAERAGRVARALDPALLQRLLDAPVRRPCRLEHTILPRAVDRTRNQLRFTGTVAYWWAFGPGSLSNLALVLQGFNPWICLAIGSLVLGAGGTFWGVVIREGRLNERYVQPRRGLAPGMAGSWFESKDDGGGLSRNVMQDIGWWPFSGLHATITATSEPGLPAAWNRALISGPLASFCTAMMHARNMVPDSAARDFVFLDADPEESEDQSRTQRLRDSLAWLDTDPARATLRYAGAILTGVAKTIALPSASTIGEVMFRSCAGFLLLTPRAVVATMAKGNLSPEQLVARARHWNYGSDVALGTGWGPLNRMRTYWQALPSPPSLYDLYRRCRDRPGREATAEAAGAGPVEAPVRPAPLPGEAPSRMPVTSNSGGPHADPRESHGVELQGSVIVTEAELSDGSGARSRAGSDGSEGSQGSRGPRAAQGSAIHPSPQAFNHLNGAVDGKHSVQRPPTASLKPTPGQSSNRWAVPRPDFPARGASENAWALQSSSPERLLPDATGAEDPEHVNFYNGRPGVPRDRLIRVAPLNTPAPAGQPNALLQPSSQRHPQSRRQLQPASQGPQ